jgi:hypothetical protein
MLESAANAAVNFSFRYLFEDKRYKNASKNNLDLTSSSRTDFFYQNATLFFWRVSNHADNPF